MKFAWCETSLGLGLLGTREEFVIRPIRYGRHQYEHKVGEALFAKTSKNHPAVREKVEPNMFLTGEWSRV